MSRRVLVAGLLALGLVACGDDGGGPSSSEGARVSQLIQDELDLPAAVADCIGNQVAEVPGLDVRQVESIIRGEGSTDTSAADAYSQATTDCADAED